MQIMSIQHCLMPFQSTLPRRERLYRLLLPVIQSYVSIHAPAKGATLYNMLAVTTERCFNPRSREGSDPSIPEYSVWSIVSIHAPAKGATSLYPILSSLLMFQSTLPRRERLNLLILCYHQTSVSIHAPAKGATSNQVTDTCFRQVSIHAPAKGATYLFRLI